MQSHKLSANKLDTSTSDTGRSGTTRLNNRNLDDPQRIDSQRIIENTEKTAKRIVNGWVLTIFACFIALRLASYLGVYGCLGFILLLVPAFALYQGWKPWIRYIFMGE